MSVADSSLVQTFADFKIGTACVRLRVQTFESPSNFKIRPRLSCPNSPIPESADLEIHFRDTLSKWIFDPADNPKPYKIRIYNQRSNPPYKTGSQSVSCPNFPGWILESDQIRRSEGRLVSKLSGTDFQIGPIYQKSLDKVSSSFTPIFEWRGWCRPHLF